MSHALLLDTDIGSDIDDALCLAYLLRQQECELLGVGTVAEDVVKRAALARVVCDAAGRPDVPVLAGSPGPLPGGPAQAEVTQYEAIRARPHSLKYIAGDAVDFYRKAIRARPGQVTLLSIGPMTNLALLFALDPEIPSLLKSLVLMAGVYTGSLGLPPGAAEFNVVKDPLAARIVFESRPAEFVCIGLDVTRRCQMPADDCRRRFAKAGGGLAIVAEMAEIWFRGRPEITFHDPLAGAVIFAPDLCKYTSALVRVETASPYVAGLTKMDLRLEHKPHRIATEVDSARFFTHYFGVVGGKD